MIPRFLKELEMKDSTPVFGNLISGAILRGQGFISVSCNPESGLIIHITGRPAKKLCPICSKA